MIFKQYTLNGKRRVLKVIWKTRTQTRTRGHGKRGHGKRGHGKRGHGKRGHEKRGHGKRGHRKHGHGKLNADMENTDMENADMKNTDKHVKNSYMVDGLPCNRFCLPEKFHVSLKYWTKWH